MYYRKEEEEEGKKGKIRVKEQQRISRFVLAQGSVWQEQRDLLPTLMSCGTAVFGSLLLGKYQALACLATTVLYFTTC